MKSAKIEGFSWYGLVDNCLSSWFYTIHTTAEYKGSGLLTFFSICVIPVSVPNRKRILNNRNSCSGTGIKKVYSHRNFYQLLLSRIYRRRRHRAREIWEQAKTRLLNYRYSITLLIFLKQPVGKNKISISVSPSFPE